MSFKFYTIQRKRNNNYKRNILLFSCLFFPFFSLAQTGPYYVFSANNGTYTSLSGPNVHQITLTTDGSEDPLDEGMSAPIPIGFTFVYNLKPFNKFRVNANGFVTLDSLLAWDAYWDNWINRISGEPKYVIAALWDDYKINAGGGIKYELSGSLGSQILKIEFYDLNFADIGGANLFYQVWLHEGTNIIEFRYGSLSGDFNAYYGFKGGASIGLNGDIDLTAYKFFMSITPGPVPAYSLTDANNSVHSSQYLTSGLIYKFTPAIRWQGTTNNDWLTKTNWDADTIPSEFDNALVPSGKSNYPIINGSGAVCDSLYIESGGELTVAGGGDLTVYGNIYNDGTLTDSSASETSIGSLILKGECDDVIKFKRFVSGGSWHLVSSPVSGQGIWDWAGASGNNIAKKTGPPDTLAITTYNEGIDDWNAYPTASFSGNFSPGTGYSTLRQNDGYLTFTGTLVNTDLNNLSITRGAGGQGWNLLGNPYTSAIGATNTASSSDYLLNTTNVSNLDGNYAALYLWDPGLDDYVIINNADGVPTGTLSQDYIQAGQGFFVRAKDNSSRKFNITRAMQVHQTAVPFKSGDAAWPTIKLTAMSSNNESSTSVSFNENMTTGLDVTYDAGMFKSNHDFALYTKLVENNGVDFAIQCLPEDYSKLVIPVGLDAKIGEEVTFSARLFNLPMDCEPYLEDRVSGKFTQLLAGATYSVTVDERYKSGALFLHTSSSFVTESKVVDLDEPFKVIPNTANGFIRVISSEERQAVAKVYDLSGRVLKLQQINNGNNNLIYFSGTPGIYIVHIENERNNFSQKIFWKN